MFYGGGMPTPKGWLKVIFQLNNLWKPARRINALAGGQLKFVLFVFYFLEKSNFLDKLLLAGLTPESCVRIIFVIITIRNLWKINNNVFASEANSNQLFGLIIRLLLRHYSIF